MLRFMVAAAIASSLAFPVSARADHVRYRALLKEMVETNTTLSSGSCTALATKIVQHLKEAGFPDSDLHPFAASDYPQEGGLVAILPGSDPNAKAILLLGHLDVVEARREDWTRDPFTLLEENGNFYGRGVADMKSQVAAWLEIMMRLKQEGFRHKRTLKLALTCGEETGTVFDGASWLVAHERALIDAEFALNEGGGGRLDKDGKPLFMGVQASEKFSRSYTLEVTNPGGHSSRPVKKNAIYQLAAGLTKISQYEFPIETTDITLGNLAKMGPLVGGSEGAAMTAFAKNPSDLKAAAIVADDPTYNAILRTTCVATLLSAGHANNALPQRANANINCRIFPGTSPQQVLATLQKVVADPEITVRLAGTRGDALAKPLALDPKVFRPVVQLTAKYWHGVPVAPVMLAAATDAAFLTPVGIPTYGVSGIFFDADGNGMHGLNEYIRADAAYRGVDFNYDLVKIYLNSL